MSRGLDEQRLIRLTGMSPEALNARRERIVHSLAADLGLPESVVREALTEIEPDPAGDDSAPTAPATAERAPEPANVAPTEAAEPPAEAAPVAAAHEASPSPHEPSPPEAPPPQVPPPERRQRRGRWAAVVLLAVVVVVVVIVLATGGGSSHSRGTTRTSTSAGASPSTTSTAAAAAPGTRGPDPFTTLPGGRAGAKGSVIVAGVPPTLKLSLTVFGLPKAPGGGHYEAWLYNSVLDSRPLGRPRDGMPMNARLPADAARFSWIDISLQPPGAVNHSGESELRAPNPAHA